VYKLHKQVPGVPATGVPVGVPPAMMAAYPVAVVRFNNICFICA